MTKISEDKLKLVNVRKTIYDPERKVIGQYIIEMPLCDFENIMANKADVLKHYKVRYGDTEKVVYTEDLEVVGEVKPKKKEAAKAGDSYEELKGKADDFFKDGNFKEALGLYEQMKVLKPNVYVNKRIKACREETEQ